jgi:aspartate oxidase
VDLGVALDQALGELANVTGEAALNQRRILPGEDQYAGDGVLRLL